MKITIDGFNGTGKTTLAKRLSKELGFISLSSGLIFRALALCMDEMNVSVNDIQQIQELFHSMDLKLSSQNDKTILINNYDVTDKIMDTRYALIASKISNNELIQILVRDYIRHYSENKNIIVDGRDSGRLLFPDADLKIALIASIEMRAQRRYNEKHNQNETIDDIKTKLIEIDKKLIESNCIPPDDAFVINTTNLTQEEVFEQALKILKKTKGNDFLNLNDLIKQKD